MSMQALATTTNGKRVGPAAGKAVWPWGEEACWRPAGSVLPGSMAWIWRLPESLRARPLPGRVRPLQWKACQAADACNGPASLSGPCFRPAGRRCSGTLHPAPALATPRSLRLHVCVQFGGWPHWACPCLAQAVCCSLGSLHRLLAK
jgi:hypothetical protein